jgi:vitamin B12 transporter
LRQLIIFGAAGPCANSFGCYENVGRSSLEGLSLSGSTTLADVRLGGSLSWHDPRNRDTGKVLVRRARQLATLTADTRAAGWLLGAELQAAGHRWDNAANTQRMGGYGLLHLSAERALMPGLALQLRVDNVADKAWETARTYPNAGRTLQLNLRWSGA